MISVVINSVNPEKFQAVSQMYRNALRGLPFEIIGVHDAQSGAEGLTRGIAASRGDVLFLSHDDVEFLTPDVGHKMLGHLNQFDVVGIAGTSRLCGPMWIYAGPPHVYGQVAHANADGTFVVEIFSLPAPAVGGIQSMDSMFIAVRRQAVLDVGFDAARYTGFHLYEADFCLRAYQCGLKLAIACDVPMIHYSRGKMGESWADQARVFLDQHGNLLPKVPPPKFRVATVLAGSKDELLPIMTPHHFADRSQQRR